NDAALDDHLRFGTEEGRFPQDEIRELSSFDGANEVRYAVRNRRVDRVFRNVAFDAQVVVPGGFARQSTALVFHFVRRLPRTGDHFANAAHRLAVTGHHADRAEVVEDIFGGDGFAANAAFGKRDILGKVRIEMVADHEHIEMLIDGIDGVRT